jgi:hypothetical protein
VAGDQMNLVRDAGNPASLFDFHHALQKAFEVISYPGEPHCFCLYGGSPPQPRMQPQDSSARPVPARGMGTKSSSASALKAYRDSEAFFQRHLMTKPRPLDPGLVKFEPA